MYKVSLAAVNVPEETYPMMEKALRAGKIGQTDLIEQFENALATYVGSEYCIAVSNGTMADAVAVAAMKTYYKYSKSVVVPALTFIAQPNSILYSGMEVVFADVKEDWTIDLSYVHPTNYLYTIVFSTDIMGRVVPNHTEIEDACEAFGSKYQGKFAGTFGLMGTYSFFPSHTISTGEGGAIVTNDPNLARLCRSIRAHGSTTTDPMNKFHFTNFGFNARLSSLQAVLGICLMKHVDEYVAIRRKNFRIMQKGLGGFYEQKDEEIVPHGYPVEFVTEKTRDAAMKNILEAGIECRKFFSCIPLEEVHYMRVGKFPVAEHISHTHLYVPCHQNMTTPDVDYVIQIVCEQQGRVRKYDPEELLEC